MNRSTETVPVGVVVSVAEELDAKADASFDFADHAEDPQRELEFRARGAAFRQAAEILRGRF